MPVFGAELPGTLPNDLFYKEIAVHAPCNQNVMLSALTLDDAHPNDGPNSSPLASSR